MSRSTFAERIPKNWRLDTRLEEQRGVLLVPFMTNSIIKIRAGHFVLFFNRAVVVRGAGQPRLLLAPFLPLTPSVDRSSGKEMF